MQVQPGVPPRVSTPDQPPCPADGVIRLHIPDVAFSNLPPLRLSRDRSKYLAEAIHGDALRDFGVRDQPFVEACSNTAHPRAEGEIHDQRRAG